MSFFPIIGAFGGSTGDGSGSTPTPVSNLKNVRVIPSGSALAALGKDYKGFGELMVTGEDRVTHFFRAATGHLTGGDIYYQHYTISTDAWTYPEVLLIDDAINMQDCAGGIMDNNEIVLFNCKSANNFGGGDWSTENFFLRLDGETMAQIGDRVDYIGGTSSVPHVERDWAFGPLAYHGTPGKYSQTILRRGVAVPSAKIGIIKTTDYFNTWTYYSITEAFADFSEVCHAYLGEEKMIALIRANNGGSWSTYYSGNGGETWTARGLSGIGHYNASVKIMKPLMYNGLLHLIFQDRDSAWIAISRGNVPAEIYDNVTNFKPVELIYYNYHPSSTYNGLGYPSMVPIVTTGVTNPVFLYVFCRETAHPTDGGAAGAAELLYSRDDLITDPVDSAPPAPTLTVPYIGPDGFNVVMTGYTDAQLQNIKYFLFDISTNSGFSSFITAKWQVTGPDSVSVMQNKRLVGGYGGGPLFIRNLTTVTTYYIRIKAVNNTGESEYSSATITTI